MVVDIDRKKIESIICICINNLNRALVDAEKISIERDNIFFGEGSLLDSMGLLNLLIDLEEHLDDQGICITILDDHALSQKNSPFRTISTLADYIYRKMQNEI